MIDNIDDDINSAAIDPELIESKNNLRTDIDHIDSRLIDITKNINLIQSNIDRVTNIILHFNSQQSQQQKIGTYYSIQGDLLKTLTGFNDSYEKLLNLKFRYRSEQNDLSLKTIRLYQIELRKLENDIRDDDVNYKHVLNAISKITNTEEKSNTNNPPFELEFEDDEKI